MEALPHMIVFLIYIIYLFIFDCAGSSLLCGLFSSCGDRGLLSSWGAQASRCSGFPCFKALAPGVAACGLNRCGTQA